MATYTRLEQYCAARGVEWERSAPLADHCSFRIGGPADLLLDPDSPVQVAEILTIAGEENIPLLVLGKGSNVLFADEGYRGIVLRLGPRYAAMTLVDDTTIDCESGASLTQLCTFAWENGLAGLEFAYGIPGSVGGAIYMNAGAYGGEMKDVLAAARHYCPRTGFGELVGDAMGLGYRHSAYTDGDRVILGGRFQLQKGDRNEIRARMDDYMSRRRAKQPLEYPSAGSTFKRPEGAYASALIDRCGLKGDRVGGAMVSDKHAGFVVNIGGATRADVLALIDRVRRVVERETGFRLECEVKILEA